MEKQLYAADFAGHCTELTAWKLLKDISEIVLNQQNDINISPFFIIINDDGSFMLSTTKENVIDRIFEAPEMESRGRTEASYVWSLAATVFFCMMGCSIMNGRGGMAQHKKSKIPYMRNGMPELSKLVQECLNYDSLQRPSLQYVHQQALTHYNLCLKKVAKGPKIKSITASNNNEVNNLDFWPDLMINH